jgi:hypothetical protein
MSDKPWDADAELGTGRTLDFGGSAENLGDPSFEMPDRPAEATPEPPAPAEPPTARRSNVRLPWIIALVVVTALAGPLFGVVIGIITAFDDVSDAIESFEDVSEVPTASENIAFLRTLDASVSGTANSLPQCFFDEASSGLCTSTYGALADLIESTSVTIECSGYRGHWVQALNRAARGQPGDLEAIYNEDSASFPLGYAEARASCLSDD